MPNYSDEYKVSEVANILTTNRETIKKIAYEFKDYLTKEANPSKGIPRVFSLDDIVVINYILFYWEDEPDYECIKIGLNRGEQWEEPYDTIRDVVVPIFREVQEYDEGTSRPLVGYINKCESLYDLADSFRLAADYLVDSAIDNIQGYELLNPILYNYRHSVELYLKAVVQDGEQIHDLKKLYDKFRIMIDNKFGEEPPMWFNDIIEVLHEFDPKSTAFRYGTELNVFEYVIDLNILKRKMSWFTNIFQKIKSSDKLL